MMTEILKCQNCDSDLSYPIRAITTVAEMEAICTFAVETPVCPPRRYLLIEGEVRKNRMDFAKGWVPQSNAWLNLEDLRDWVGFSPIPGRTQGCCDISSAFGPNRVCQCGEHIGTQSSDCYEYRMFEPLMEATVWKETKEETR